MTAPSSAMIFAAGFGTRMGPLTRDLPKPMVPLAGRPMIDHAIDLLRGAGINRIVANVHYLADKLVPHLERHDIIVSHEEQVILETGGGLRAALPLLGDGPVITLNPDALWLGKNPVETLLENWQDHMDALLVLIDQSRAVGSVAKGDFSLEHGEILRNGPYLYGGAQIIRTDRLGEIDASAFSLNRYWDHLSKTAPLNGVVHEGRWCDIGTPDGLKMAERALADV